MMKRSEHCRAPRLHAHSDIEVAHTFLVRLHRALESPDRLFVVDVTGDHLSVEEIALPELTVFTGRYLHHRISAVAARLEHGRGSTYLCAYSLRARQYAETLRPRLEALQWNIVHADVTGAQAAVPPCAPGEPGGFERNAQWLGSTIRERRVGALLKAWHWLGEEPHRPLPQACLRECLDALREPDIALHCLTWASQRALTLWQHLSSCAPENIIAGALLAAAQQQLEQHAQAQVTLAQIHMRREQRFQTPVAVEERTLGRQDAVRVEEDIVLAIVDQIINWDLAPVEVKDLVDFCLGPVTTASLFTTVCELSESGPFAQADSSVGNSPFELTEAGRAVQAGSDDAAVDAQTRRPKGKAATRDSHPQDPAGEVSAGVVAGWHLVTGVPPRPPADPQKAALDRVNLAHVLNGAHRRWPDLAQVVLHTSDQNYGHGFVLHDVTAADGRSLHQGLSPQDEQEIWQQITVFLESLDWDALVGEDQHGCATWAPDPHDSM
ncbi:hypothetical protein GCM10027456_40290 [Kineosporia babensis]